MKIYQVGGCVRDRLMGRVPNDFDFVVVGSTPAEMKRAGFSQVGSHFPVFLDAKGDEYALARVERKVGEGHKGFECDVQDVSLEQDLSRRDLTVNAIAYDPVTNEIIDPFGGVRDIKNGILRHVTDDGFREDPLRVLRIARFLARWPEASVAPETMALCEQMTSEGMMKQLSPERVALEMTKTFYDGGTISRFFIFLKMVGALEDVFPHIHALVGVPQPEKHHPEGDAFVHTMLVVDEINSLISNAPIDGGTVDKGFRAIACFCALTHDLGKARTDKTKWPKHHAHEALGVPVVNEMCDQLNLSNDFRGHAIVVAQFHTHIHNFMKLRPSTVVDMFMKTKHRQNKWIDTILPLVSAADARGRGPFFKHSKYPNFKTARDVLKSLAEVKARDVCTEEELKDVGVIKRKVYAEMVRRVNDIRSANSE